MIQRNPKFKVSFGYVCPSSEKVIFGKLEEQVFTFKDLEFMLKTISPFSSIEHISIIRGLPRNDVYRITFKEMSEHGMVLKAIVVKRN